MSYPLFIAKVTRVGVSLTRVRISDHMCRMALMAMMMPTDPQRPLNIARCVMVRLTFLNTMTRWWSTQSLGPS